VLNNDPSAPQDLKQKSIYLGGLLFEHIEKCKVGEGSAYALQLLESGAAKQKFEEIRQLQGARELPALSETYFDFVAERDGTIKSIDNKVIVQLCKLAGAPMDILAGVYIYRFNGETVKKGDTLFRIYSGHPTRLQYAIEHLEKNTGCYVIE
jgi:thymidine phosphorylase